MCDKKKRVWKCLAYLLVDYVSFHSCFSCSMLSNIYMCGGWKTYHAKIQYKKRTHKKCLTTQSYLHIYLIHLFIEQIFYKPKFFFIWFYLDSKWSLNDTNNAKINC